MSRQDSRTAIPLPAAQAPTVSDLLSRLGSDGAPPLLALTILVQLFRYLDELHQTGEIHGAVHPGCLFFEGRTVGQLLTDPTRDPRLRIERKTVAPEAFVAPEVRAGQTADAEADLWSAGAVLRSLLGERSQREAPASAWELADRLLAPASGDTRSTARPTAALALASARQAALEILADWDRERSIQRLEEGLAAALEVHDDVRVAMLTEELAEIGPQSSLLKRARRWLGERQRREVEIRHHLGEAVYRRREREAAWQAQRLDALLGDRAADDVDLQVARQWLNEAAIRSTANRVVKIERRRKLLVTAAPLLGAVLLALLLLIVLTMAVLGV